MKNAVNHQILVVKVWFDSQKVYMEMNDGRVVGAPLAWFPTLANATDGQRNNWRLRAKGYGVHWPDINEDLSAEGMFTYSPPNSVELAHSSAD
jgi:hypothetical protein